MKNIKKLFFLVITLCLFLTGCSKKESNEDSTAILYESYYESISSNTSYVETSEKYSLSAELTKVASGSYCYKIILDDAQVAMYDIVMMVVEDDVSYADSSKMMPSVGIYDDSYSLIPNQVNRNRNYVKGVVLSGETTNNSITLKLLVEWSNKSHEKTFREFWNITLNEENSSFNSQELVSNE